MSLPKTYKAAVIEEANAPFKIKDIEYKSPESGKVVVKDSMTVEQAFPTGLPRIPGHEIVGRVVEVPQDEKRWKVGDLVGSGWHGGHCGVCSRCIRGDFVTCESEGINGVSSDGGHAEYATLRTEALCAIPDDIEPAKAAPLLCAGITVFNSIRSMSLHPGDVVAVQGVGGLGHLAIQFARKMGYVVAAVSRGDSKKQLALDLGAHHYIDSEDGNAAEALQKLGGAKVIAAVAPSGPAMASLIPGLAVNGQLIILAPVEKLEIPTVPMIMKRLSVRGWPSGTAADCEDTLKFAQAMGVDCKIETYPLEKIQDAYDSMMNNKARFRSVIVFE
ncbi:hypothetical protein Rhopal_006623-T1 [Rhodotorula paludigena]|uniref:Alcohol dehydrogenase n=1 Tax=Rhodotorula paludigena TaxID=86838 RepID=A0AAV5GVP6_9BASI|nr:hypothetical protein Rhopal_006623-T1 [Rhodotorula paludigena]